MISGLMESINSLGLVWGQMLTPAESGFSFQKDNNSQETDIGHLESVMKKERRSNSNESVMNTNKYSMPSFNRVNVKQEEEKRMHE